jgi:tRNA pseudouridine38-40 synthase
MMRTIRLDLAYDGTGFRGWAKQPDPGIRTIEGELGAVLSRVLGDDVRLSVAGRTDAGVHARGQVASFATASGIEPARLQAAINGALAPEVVVWEAAYAADGFDARFFATSREYRYAIDVAAVPDPFTARFVWHRPRPLALARMRSAARYLEGEHDFVSFCRSPGGGRSTVRDLRSVSVVRDGDVVRMRFRANGFLHQMVRSLVGALVTVGDGRLEPSAIPDILARRDRSAAPPLAPPNGLILERVIYGRRA